MDELLTHASTTLIGQAPDAGQKPATASRQWARERGFQVEENRQGQLMCGDRSDITKKPRRFDVGISWPASTATGRWEDM